MTNKAIDLLLGTGAFVCFLFVIGYNIWSINIAIESQNRELDMLSQRIIICDESLTREKVKSKTPPVVTPEVYCSRDDNTGVWECGTMSDFNEAQEPYH